MLSPMPMGASPRLEAVLRAGQMHRAADATRTGAPGDGANDIVRRASVAAKRGSTSPKPLKRTSTSPKPLKRTSTSPKPLKRGNTSPAKMQDAARAAVTAPGASKSRAMQRGNTSPARTKLKGAAQAALLSASVGKKDSTPAKPATPSSRDSSPSRAKLQGAIKTVARSNSLAKKDSTPAKPAKPAKPASRDTSPARAKLKAAGQAALLSTTVGKGAKGARDPTQDAGKPPILPAGAPATTDKNGFTLVDGAGPAKKVVVNKDGRQYVGKTSELVEDLVNKYREKTQERLDDLERARKSAEECEETRRRAVSAYQEAQEKASSATIKSLQSQLADKEALLLKMQNQSEEALKQLKDTGDASAAIAQLEAEKQSVQDQLARLKENSNEMRDVAAREAAAQLASAESECEKKLAAADAEVAEKILLLTTERDECNDKLTRALADLEAEVKAHNVLEKLKEEEEDKFHNAARAACAALSSYQDDKDTRFSKKMENFVTSAPARGSKANDVTRAQMRA